MDAPARPQDRPAVNPHLTPMDCAFVSLASPHQVEAEDKGDTEEEAVKNLAKRIGITIP